MAGEGTSTTSTDAKVAAQNFKRFLYVTNEELRFISGDPIVHDNFELDKVPSIKTILSSDKPEVLLQIVETVNSENASSYREAMLFSLAAALVHMKTDQKYKVVELILRIVKDPKEVFDVYKFYIDLKGGRHFGSSVKKMFSTYYKSKEPTEFAKMVTRYQSYHGFTHKDIFKLVHPKCVNELWGLVSMYIMFGIKQVQAKAAEVPESAEIVNYLVDVEALKRSEDENAAADLVRKHRMSMNQVPSILSKSKAIWEAIIPQLTLQELLHFLPKLNKNGFFKHPSPIMTAIVDRLTNQETVTESKIHPIQVFIDMKNLEKGGKNLDGKYLHYLQEKEEEKANADPSYVKQDVTAIHVPKCTQISGAVQKTLEHSYRNLVSTGKRTLICVQPYSEEEMEKPCLTTRHLSCIEATAILVLSILKAERDVIVAIFNGNDLKVLQMEKTFKGVITKLKQSTGDYVLPTKPMEWAMGKKKQIDLFINVVTSHKPVLDAPKEKRAHMHLHDTLENYRKKVSMPHSKAVNVCLSQYRLCIGQNKPSCLDVSGFDKNTLKVINAFSTNLFE